jgi:hypothetical protein
MPDGAEKARKRTARTSKPFRESASRGAFGRPGFFLDGPLSMFRSGGPGVMRSAEKGGETRFSTRGKNAPYDV